MAENLRSRMGHAAADFLDKDFRELLAATGLSTERSNARRALYRRAVDERSPLRFDTPSSGLRDALEVSVYPVMDQHGTCTHILWNGRNIAKRMAAEAGRRESEERYALGDRGHPRGNFRLESGDWRLLISRRATKRSWGFATTSCSMQKSHFSGAFIPRTLPA